MNSVKGMYLTFLKAGLPPKQAAKMVQEKTGLHARTGLPLKSKQGSVEIYAAENKTKGYLGQYGT